MKTSFWHHNNADFKAAHAAIVQQHWLSGTSREPADRARDLSLGPFWRHHHAPILHRCRLSVRAFCARVLVVCRELGGHQKGKQHVFPGLLNLAAALDRLGYVLERALGFGVAGLAGEHS